MQRQSAAAPNAESPSTSNNKLVPSSSTGGRGDEADIVERTLPITSIASQAIVDTIITPLKDTLTSPTIRKVAISSVFLATIVALSLGSAIFAYALFYYLYVPRVGFSTDLWLQYGQGQVPFANIGLSKAALASDLAYDVIVDLIVPASTKNLDLGNFMVDLTLFTEDGLIVLRSARAASLTWAPPLARLMTTIFRLPFFLLFNSYSPTQRLKIPIVSKQVLGTFSTGRIAKGLVKIGRQDGIPSSVNPPISMAAAIVPTNTIGEVQVYSATINFIAHLSGLRWLMFYHRIISFVIFSTAFFFISVTSALLLWGIAGYMSSTSANLEDENDNADQPQQAEIESVKTEDDDTASEASISFIKAREQNMSQEERTRRELHEQARRLAEARRRAEILSTSNTDDDTRDDKTSVLQHLSFDTVNVASTSGSGSTSEDDAVLVKRESKIESNGEEDKARRPIKQEGANDDNHVDVKVSTATIKDEGGISGSTARASTLSNIRRRVSSRSMREHEIPSPTSDQQ